MAFDRSSLFDVAWYVVKALVTLAIASSQDHWMSLMKTAVASSSFPVFANFRWASSMLLRAAAPIGRAAPGANVRPLSGVTGRGLTARALRYKLASRRT